MKKTTLYVLLSLVCTFSCLELHAQYINRFAGNGTLGYSGDGGQAALASINGPSDLAFSSSGNMYFCDVSNHVIRKITTAGIITTVAGTGSAGATGDGGAATAATLDAPFAIAVSSAGNIYFADVNQHTVRKISTTGTITKIAGTAGSSGYSGDGGAATAALLNAPIGIAVDAAGNVYVSDQGNNVIRKINTSGVISTIVGNGTAGYSGDGGAATAAMLNTPTGLAIDASGNLYIADFYNSVIRKRTSAGIISTVAGNGSAGYSGDGGAATNANLQYAEGVAVDASGNIFIADRYNSVIRRVNPSGIISTVAGNGTGTYAGEGGIAALASIYQPSSAKLDASGNLYICDLGNDYIRKVNVGIAITANAGTGICSGTASSFNAYIFSTVTTPFYQWKVNGTNVGTNTPSYSSSTLANGNTVSCQLRNTTSGGTLIGTSNNITMVVSSTPRITLGTNPVNCVGDSIAYLPYSAPVNSPKSLSITWDAAAIGRGFLNGIDGQLIYTLAGGASTGYSGDGGPAYAAALSGTRGIVMDAIGNIYVTDRFNYVVRKIDTFGIITTIAGNGTAGNSGDGGPATNANLSPFSIGIDVGGNLYVTDIDNNVIRKISTSGIISRVAGNGTAGYSGDGGAATSAEILQPIGLAITSTGNIYFSDANNVVRKISSSGIITTIAGTGTAGYSGNGGPATLAAMSAPTGLVFDAAGNLYVTEFGNNVVRKISASGIISTFAGTGTSGYTGDGGPATSATFYNPEGITIDATGNYFIADRNNNVVRKIDLFGNISTYAGIAGSSGYSGDGYLANAAALQGPIDVKTDAFGNLYIAEGPRVRVVNSFPRAPLAMWIPDTAGPGVYHGTLTISNGLCSDTSYAFTVTINPTPLPGVITGPSVVCVGSGITLTDTVTGGVWSRSNATATISTAGLVTGVSAGIDTFTYTVTSGCGTVRTTHTVTINPLPNAGSISGSSSVCTGATITLTDASGGGAWTSTNSNAIVSSSGVVGGLSAGIDTIKYTVTNSCGTAVTSKQVTVNPAPNAGTISGTSALCQSTSTTLTSTTTGGTWSVANTHASITTGGSVTGITAGVDTIVYSVTNGCGSASTNFPITILALPNAGTISGASSVCVSAATTLTSSATGGAWGTTNGHAFASSTGSVSGISAGVDTIVYAVFNSCGVATTSATITINPLPSAGTISGATSVCPSSSTTLTESVTGGIWSATNTHASITTSGLVSGITPGTDTIIYTVTNICGSTSTSLPFTVNPPPNAGTISGTASVCVGATATLSETVSGGSWTVINSHASVSSSGMVSGLSQGIDTVIYSVTNMCGTTSATFIMIVNPLPNAGTITGSTVFCAGDTSTLTDAAPGGSWTATNSHATISTTGFVTTFNAGLDTMVYTVANGCGTTSASRIISINPLPIAGTISGSSSLCAGSTITLSETSTSGSWSATNSHALISSSGVVTGMTAGVDTIVYTVTNSCGTISTSAVITINPLPVAGTIAGASSVCVSSSITLTDSSSGGVFTATNGHATISTSGTLNGMSAGVDTIIYTVTNSCGTATTTKIITINPLAVVRTITGAATVCEGSSTTLTDTITGGAWSATNSRAIVSSVGLVLGLTTGIDTIVYTVTNSCNAVSASKIITVNPLPDAGAITGPSEVCIGSAITLANTATGGTWTATNGNGTLSGSTFTGVIAGSDNVTYTDSNSCGTAIASKTITINALPVPVITATGAVLSTTIGHVTYQWILNGTPIPGATNPTYVASEDSSYTVTVTDANGCSATSLGYTPALGVNNITPAAMDISIYPNPSESVVYIKSPVKVNVSVFSIDGRMVINLPDVQSIDMSALASGAYMLVIYDHENGAKLRTERIVKMGE